MFGTKQVGKAKKAAAPKPKKAATKKSSGSISSGTRAGGAGYRKYEGDALWLPNTSRPDWLDGSLPGAPLSLPPLCCLRTCAAV